MGKRSQRRPLRYEKEQGGCISGLMSIFDLRRSRTARKLLADTRRANSQATASTGEESTGVGQAETKPNENCHGSEEAEKSETVTTDVVKASVKRLMEEEMIREQVTQTHMDVSRGVLEESNSEKGKRARKNRRRRNKTSRKSIDIDIYDGESPRKTGPDNLCQQINGQKISNNMDLEAILEELRQIHQGEINGFKNDLNGGLDIHSDQGYIDVQEKLSEAIKVFMSQRLTNGSSLSENGSNRLSKEFMDAFQATRSNKELFLKLLQDPNSLLMKHIKGFEGAPQTNEQKPVSLPQSNISEEVPTKSEQDEPIVHKPRKFFRRRSKSQDSYPMEGDETCNSSSRTVILKPGTAGNNMSTTLQSRFSLDNKVQGDKHSSHFSFTEIKRKLKHAIGKEHQVTSSNKILYRSSSERENRGEEKGIGGEYLGWRSPNRNHFYTEIFAKPSNGVRKVNKVAKSIDVEAATSNESSGYPVQGVSNIYMEAKKHLSDMLNNEQADTELISGKLPRSLGRILSLPEYKDSPRSSPEKHTEASVMTARMRLSAHSSSHGIDNSTDQLVQGNSNDYSSPSEKGQFPDANSGATSKNILESSVEETSSFKRDGTTSEGIYGTAEKTESTDQEEFETFNEEKSVHSLALESFEEDQESSSPLASPSCSSNNRKVEDYEKVIDRVDRPSPISVLEPLFSEDDISPSSSINRQVEFEIHPRKIHFEEEIPPASDHGTSTCMEDGESPFEYVEAVLLGSGFNWDEFLLRWLSSDQILEPSLFDEVELFSSRRHDQKLLFDCTNEVLNELCDRYFSCFTSISLPKQSIRPAPTGMNLINEIWEGVEWHLLQHPSSKSLDQLVKNDLSRSKLWMNPHLDVEYIGIEMEEAIFEELVEDTFSCLINDNLECQPTDFPAGSCEIEISS